MVIPKVKKWKDHTLTKDKKRKKKITKAQLNKWRKETNACEHDKVGYQAIMKLAEGMFARSKQDAWNIEKLSGVLNSQNILLKDNKKGISMLVDKYEDRIAELEKQAEELTKQRNDSTRAYNGLAQIGKFAQQMGIDLQSAQEDLPEDEKNKYDFKQTDTLMESGKVKTEMKLTPKKKKEDQCN